MGQHESHLSRRAFMPVLRISQYEKGKSMRSTLRLDEERLPHSRKRGRKENVEWTDPDSATRKSTLPHTIGEPVWALARRIQRYSIRSVHARRPGWNERASHREARLARGKRAQGEKRQPTGASERALKCSMRKAVRTRALKNRRGPNDGCG